MPLIEWKEKYMLDIDNIDLEHQGIISDMNLIYDELINVGDQEELIEHLAGLVLKTRHHFNNEERYMLNHFYPDTEAHIGQHMRFQLHLSTLIHNVKNDQKSFALDNLRYIAHWYIDHITGADASYARMAMLNRHNVV